MNNGITKQSIEVKNVRSKIVKIIDFIVKKNIFLKIKIQFLQMNQQFLNLIKLIIELNL